METKVQYNSKEDRDTILDEYSHLFLIEEQNISEGNFLIFSDTKPVPPKVYVTVPEEEFESLKQSEMILQIALAESIEKQETDKVNSQVALAELIETLNIQGVL